MNQSFEKPSSRFLWRTGAVFGNTPFLGGTFAPFCSLVMHLERVEYAQKTKGKYLFPRYSPSIELIFQYFPFIPLRQPARRLDDTEYQRLTELV